MKISIVLSKEEERVCMNMYNDINKEIGIKARNLNKGQKNITVKHKNYSMYYNDQVYEFNLNESSFLKVVRKFGYLMISIANTVKSLMLMCKEFSNDMEEEFGNPEVIVSDEMLKELTRFSNEMRNYKSVLTVNEEEYMGIIKYVFSNQTVCDIIKYNTKSGTGSAQFSKTSTDKEINFTIIDFSNLKELNEITKMIEEDMTK